ncbi:S-adenosylmethionine decarboxylase family protein [Novipirellula galeiformis]|nr:S-adenosylmethionine decarboxylase [Novipirellula galeiformis]
MKTEASFPLAQASGALPHSLTASVGSEWIVDAYGCEPRVLQDLKVIAQICEDAVAYLGLQVLGQPQQHAFPGHGGVTAMYMLSESHLACHTYPEHRLATFNLYCCRDRPGWNWQKQLEDRLGSTEVLVRRVERGNLVTQRMAQRGQE